MKTFYIVCEITEEDDEDVDDTVILSEDNLHYGTLELAQSVALEKASEDVSHIKFAVVKCICLGIATPPAMAKATWKSIKGEK